MVVAWFLAGVLEAFFLCIYYMMVGVAAVIKWTVIGIIKIIKELR